MEDLTAQELVKYTLRIVKHEYDGQTAEILGQQRRGSRHVNTLPPIFQEREAVENLTKGLAEL